MSRPTHVLTGLVLLGLAGCHSYYPRGYGGASPYPTMTPGPGAYVPAATAPQAAYSPNAYQPQASGLAQPNNYQSQPGQASTPSAIRRDAAAPGGPEKFTDQKRVPEYPDARPIPETKSAGPASLGSPALDEDDSIPRGSSLRSNPPAGLDSLTNDGEDELSALGEEVFAKPVRTAAATDSELDTMPRNMQRPVAAPNGRSPYKRAADYTWLRGKPVRDPQTRRWLLKYSDDPDEDEFGGALEIVGNEKIERLLEDDVILVRGEIDSTRVGAGGRPVYRVSELKPLQPVSGQR